MDIETADSTFHYFSDEGRRSLLRLLAEVPLSVGEISEVMRLPQSTVSRHLKALRSTGLLVEQREGNRVICSLAPAAENGHGHLFDLLNQWLRDQALTPEIKTRLDLFLSDRENGADAFGRLAHRWDELRHTYLGNQFHLEALTALLPRDWHVLDLGTGTGYLLPVLSGHFREVTAVDPSEAMLELAERRARQLGLENVTFHHGTMESLELSDDSVEAVFAILVFHHIEHPARTLRELGRVMKPGGKILILELEAHENEEFQREMGDPVRGFPPDQLKAALAEAGLQPEIERRLEIGPESGAEKKAPDLYLVRARKAATSPGQSIHPFEVRHAGLAGSPMKPGNFQGSEKEKKSWPQQSLPTTR